MIIEERIHIVVGCDHFLRLLLREEELVIFVFFVLHTRTSSCCCCCCSDASTHLRLALTPVLWPAAEELECTSYLADVQRLADEPDWATLQRQIATRTDDRAVIVRELNQVSRASW